MDIQIFHLLRLRIGSPLNHERSARPRYLWYRRRKKRTNIRGYVPVPLTTLTLFTKRTGAWCMQLLPIMSSSFSACARAIIAPTEHGGSIHVLAASRTLTLRLRRGVTCHALYFAEHRNASRTLLNPHFTVDAISSSLGKPALVVAFAHL